ncbi:MAG: biopolymer transporter ExbD [Flavobacteriaceae bacterium]|nr:biopolymer transporter ExbD [Flavobacteriaceae bacterium]
MARRSSPEVNAGSMADIAFLLLIFFLVTTTIEKDKGIARQLPPKQDEQIDPPDIKNKNIFIVLVNKNDQLLVEDEPMEIGNLREAAIAFLDNGGAPQGSPEFCSYCQGDRDPASSDNPNKAIISVKSDRLTSYDMYIGVQNELVAAYNFLRNRESQRLYGWKYTEVKSALADGSYKGNEELAEERLKEIQDLYPLKLSEAEPKKTE